MGCKTPESFIFGLFENFKSLYCLESNSTQYRLLKFSKSPKMKLSGVLHTFDFLCKTQKIDFSKKNILYRGGLPPPHPPFQTRGALPPGPPVPNSGGSTPRTTR